MKFIINRFVSGKLVVIFSLVFFLISIIGVKTAKSADVDLELVLAIDTSTSVDDKDFALQQIGLAKAFLHPRVIDAILSTGELGIAVSVIHWAGTNRQTTVVNWTILRSGLDAKLFAAKIFAAKRVHNGMTDIGGAIAYSVSSLENNGIIGYRRTIDVSGDGTGNPIKTAAGRDLALAKEIIVNGLVIDEDDLDLGVLSKLVIRQHYRDYVIGGAGSFLMIADGFSDFARAIKLKLVREIRGLSIAGIDANDQVFD